MIENMSISQIKTERLILVPPSVDCFDMYERFYTDADASRLYGGPISRGAAWSRLKSDLGSWYLSGFGVWVIKFQDELVGTCGFWQGKDWPRELTWWLLPDARKKGLAYESSRAVVSHAYEVFNWDIVETYMNDTNLPARTLVEKLGGVKNRRETLPDGLERNIYVIPNPA
jgi:ribosomal-protein-alanine N-acetyltransferase